jgi:signal transduction histidine kinase
VGLGVWMAREPVPDRPDDLFRLLSRELRRPLASVLGTAEIVLSEQAGPLTEAQRRLLAGAERGAQRLVSIVDDLLVLAESGAVPGPEPAGVAGRASPTEPGAAASPTGQGAAASPTEQGAAASPTRPAGVTVLVAAVIEAALDRVAGCWTEARPGLHRSGSCDGAYVPGRLDRLAQALGNVLDNAVRCTPPDGRIEIDTRVEERWVNLAVADSGFGIPTDELPGIFEPFVRSSRSVSDLRPGLGIGLTVARLIVADSGGTIRVGPTPGGGTLALLVLPRVRPDGGEG